MKVKLFDKVVISKSSKILAVGGTIIGIISALFSEIVSKNSCIILGVWGVIYFVYHLVIWRKENKIKCLNLKINDSEIEIINGDILEGQRENCLKVIAFNEYFDTIVDEKIISSQSINGKFIKSLSTREVEALKVTIKNDAILKQKKKELDCGREEGEKQKYKIGSIVKYQEKYLITAFSKFNRENKAILTLAEYVEFLMEFWNEVDRVYAGKVVELPLLGGGITRFPDTGNTLSHQEIIENILWTFKISRLKFRYPAKVRILIYSNQEKNEMDEINLIKLREMYKND